MTNQVGNTQIENLIEKLNLQLIIELHVIQTKLHFFLNVEYFSRLRINKISKVLPVESKWVHLV